MIRITGPTSYFMCRNGEVIIISHGSDCRFHITSIIPAHCSAFDWVKSYSRLDEAVEFAEGAGFMSISYKVENANVASIPP